MSPQWESCPCIRLTSNSRARQLNTRCVTAPYQVNQTSSTNKTLHHHSSSFGARLWCQSYCSPWEMHLNPAHQSCVTLDEEMPPQNKRTHLRGEANSSFFSQMGTLVKNAGGLQIVSGHDHGHTLQG